ncbi:hypothetical protein MBOU_25980 [Mycobacterium bourgelatii]|uniref:Uncharacterized protein n=1 Tax=Mycobacterium bourgelatii TaxID=1273442 RepID=A0A7I9YPF1_MYCBU|nr:hypothetical protein MBOU_25980 [Mycobacterium bourgelatii]
MAQARRAHIDHDLAGSGLRIVAFDQSQWLVGADQLPRSHRPILGDRHERIKIAVTSRLAKTRGRDGWVKSVQWCTGVGQLTNGV